MPIDIEQLKHAIVEQVPSSILCLLDLDSILRIGEKKIKIFPKKSIKCAYRYFYISFFENDDWLDDRLEFIFSINGVKMDRISGMLLSELCRFVINEDNKHQLSSFTSVYGNDSVYVSCGRRDDIVICVENVEWKDGWNLREFVARER